MLSGYQLEIVGFDNRDGGTICWDCAVKEYGALTIERQRMGLNSGVPEGDLVPLISYVAGERAGENGYHCGCADEMDEDIPHRGEEPEDYPTDAPVDEGYYSRPMLNSVTGKVESHWNSLIYHAACARLDCANCGKDISA